MKRRKAVGRLRGGGMYCGREIVGKPGENILKRKYIEKETYQKGEAVSKLKEKHTEEKMYWKKEVVGSVKDRSSRKCDFTK